MTTQTLTPATRTGAARVGALALAVVAVIVTVALGVLFARHAVGLDAHHLLHGVGMLPAPVRNLIGGTELSHLAH